VTAYLVDADVLSEPQKPRPNVAVVGWLRDQESNLYTSAIVVGEIAWGIERLPEGKKRNDLSAWLQGRVIPKMEGRILRFDTRVALEWGALQGKLERLGRKMPWRDSVIAATALRHGLAIATRNVKDYKSSDVELLNPFA
jgi:toxin FitB